MKKSEIDNYINLNYSLLQSIASGLVSKSKRNYDACILISEAYLHVLNISEQITDTDQLQRFIIAKINMEVRFTNSKTNRQNRFNENSIDDTIINREETPYTLSAIDYYLEHENDSIMKFVAEAYLVKGHNTVRKFNEYFNFSSYTSTKFINKLKNRIKEYEQEIQSRV